MKALPNILTIGRLVLTLVVLAFLVAAAGGFPWAQPDEGVKAELRFWAFVAFVVAAVTDFFDGWAARKLNAVSLLGAILDPIADKVLVAAAIVGLLASGDVEVALPGGLILFREFSVSALRETLAPKGLRLPVTVLAKWKTTTQLIALAALLWIHGTGGFMKLVPGSYAWGLACYFRPPPWTLALLWLATAITLWTGLEYALAARKALRNPS
jgi:CDP-diacylglycerol--glycerol-3-phosphate 3-phosphatidyltransferase